MNINYSYRGWLFTAIGTERIQGAQLWWDWIITNDQNSDEINVSTQRFTPPMDEGVFDQMITWMDNYIDNNGGTIG